MDEQKQKFQLRNSTVILCVAIVSVTTGFLVGGPALGGLIAGALVPFVSGAFVYKYKTKQPEK
ncbi:MAG: hypothetical protein M0Q12_00025 [Synergistaceae bacterium]|jgi:hypothetical protein|nr:hypothetical protein [Synergistaceae bacterium]